MKQPTFHGRVLLPLSVFAEARAGNPLAMERILRYYDGYMNKLCTRTLYELDGTPHVRVDEYMKHRLQNKLIRAILKDRRYLFRCRSASFFRRMAASGYGLYLHSIIHISCLVFFGRMKYNKKCYRRYEYGQCLATPNKYRKASRLAQEEMW